MSVPEFGSTSGAAVVEIAAMAGLVLDPWQQLVLDGMFAERPDGKLSAFEVGLIVSRQNGKGSILEAAELGWLFLFGEPLILHSAHEFKTSSEAFLRIKSLIEGCDDLLRQCKKPRTSHGEESIELLTGQRLRFVARSSGSGRGFTGHKVVLDEAYALQPRHMAALLPTLSAVPNPQIVYTSSAGMLDSEVLNRLCDRGEAGTSARLAYYEWSADPKADFDDRAAWAQANPALGYRISEEFIEAERDAMPDAEFGRERLGIREDPSRGGPISLDTWAALTDPESQALDPVAFAVDVSPDRAWSSISSAGLRADGAVHPEVVDRRPGTDWVVRRLKELSTWSPCATVVDAGAAAGSLLPDLAEAGIEVLSPTVKQLGQATGAFIDLANADGKLRHLGQQSMLDALAGARLRPLGDAFAWDRRHSSVDITPLVSATLAVWGFSVKQAEFVDVTQAIH
jgi:phage terminase large subunit-like protein